MGSRRQPVVSVCPWRSLESSHVVVYNVFIHTPCTIRLKGRRLLLWNAPTAPCLSNHALPRVQWIKLNQLPFNVKVTLMSLCNSVLPFLNQQRWWLGSGRRKGFYLLSLVTDGWHFEGPSLGLALVGNVKPAWKDRAQTLTEGYSSSCHPKGFLGFPWKGAME